MNMMTVLWTKAEPISNLNRRKWEGSGSLLIGRKRAVGRVEGARRSAMKQSQSATTAYAATLNAQAMPIRFHGQRMEVPRPRQHCRQKSVCPRLRYLPITQGAASATRYTSHTVNRSKSHTQSLACPTEVKVLEGDLSVWMNRSANHRRPPIAFPSKHLLTHRPPEHQAVGPRRGQNHHDTSQSIRLHPHLHNDSTILACTIIRHRA